MQGPSPYRFAILLAGFMLTLAMLLIPGMTSAQGERCFPETGYCISGPIRAYWEANGGLPVFGYPITAQAEEMVEDWVGPVQWFERDRLEDHGSLGVMAGRLGARMLEMNNTPWQTFATVDSAPAGCRYFEVTRHSLCEPFLSYWEQNGGLPRFGYPVTEGFTMEIGDWSGTVQYFERRRMEHHVEYAGTQYEVLLGLLGNELKDRMSSPNPYPAPADPTAAPVEPSPTVVPPTATAAPVEPTAAPVEPSPTAVPPTATAEPTATAVPPSYQPGVCLTAREIELGSLINQYRAEYGLPPISISKSLSHVAQLHVVDLFEERPHTGTDARGMACNLHSWSDKGPWTPVCYTSDHAYAEGMWNKPREITQNAYSGNGYEISSFGATTAAGALDLWKGSPGHNAVIIEANGWNGWNAMGTGFYENFAVVWFGHEADPQGSISQCN